MSPEGDNRSMSDASDVCPPNGSGNSPSGGSLRSVVPGVGTPSSCVGNDIGICVECVMLSVTRAQPRTVEHVMPRSARAQPRTIFPSDWIISGIR